MNFKLTSLLLPVMFLLISVWGHAAEKEIFVSMKGNDSNDGSLNSPVATISRAVELAGNVQEDKVTIRLLSGVYDLKETVTISNFRKDLTIAPQAGESVNITGGVRISGFRPVKKKLKGYHKLKKDVRKKVMYVDLKKFGIANPPGIKPRGFGFKIKPAGLMLFFNNEPMTIARWPNEGWTRTGDTPKKLNGKGFKYIEEEPGTWENTGDIWMHGYWKWDWADARVKIDKIDPKKKEITISDPQSRYPYHKDRRYYVYNVLEELDSPGEWFLDKEENILYFYPPSDIKNAEMYVSLMTEPLFRIEHCRNVTVKDVVLEYTNGAGIIITGGSGNKIQDCVIRNIGTVAASIGKMEAESKLYNEPLYDGDAGTNNGVLDCEIYNCGEGGIILGGGDRKTLTPSGNYVENTRIYKASQWVRTYRAGIFMYGVGNMVRHCEISELPHTAIFFRGNDQTVEYNNIYNVCMETADAGAIYNGRDWTQRGHLIRYNYIHNLHGVETHGSFNDVMGVYLDDFSSGTIVYGNIFYKAGRNILIGGGRDNIVENNIFIEGYPGVHVDARGIGWAGYYFKGDKESILFKRYKIVDAGNPPYSEKYPQLKTVLNDHPEMPLYNCIETNVFCGGRWRDLKNKLTEKEVCFKNNVVKDSCGFYKLNGNEIEIDFSSDIFPEGFENIPVEEIGIHW
ncbi:MAG: right-handed parallel beta-helix repeat-containing protein [Chlorobi bacterium]|nr:right-handed parallel beta-helix repeat-containing protein [Chlorobiota bacterium]